MLEANSVAVRVCALTEDHSDARISVVADLATSCRLSYSHKSYDLFNKNCNVYTFLKRKAVTSSRFLETFEIFDRFFPISYSTGGNGRFTG